jgi:hypothetical protein
MGNIFKKIVIGLLILFGVICVVVYTIYLSSQLANKEELIPVRYKFAGKIGSMRMIMGLPMTDHCGRTVLPILVLARLPEEGMYRYSLQGRLQAIDTEQQEVTLQCGNGKSYIFNINMTATKEGYIEMVGISEEAGTLHKEKWRFDAIGEQYDQSQIYDIVWRDARRLPQILSEYRLDPGEAINRNTEVRAEIMRYQ